MDVKNYFTSHSPRLRPTESGFQHSLCRQKVDPRSESVRDICFLRTAPVRMFKHACSIHRVRLNTSKGTRESRVVSRDVFLSK